MKYKDVNLKWSNLEFGIWIYALKKKISRMIGYLFNKLHVVNMLNITGCSKNLKSMSLTEKNRCLRLYSKYFHRTSSEIDVFIAILTIQKLFYTLL